MVTLKSTFKWLLHLGHYMLNNKAIPSNVKKSHKFCSFFGSKQLIKVSARVTCFNSAIVDHVLSSFLFLDRVTHSGVIDIGLSDHTDILSIYCTRKISRIKRSLHKQIKIRLFNHYMIDLFGYSILSEL